MNLCTILCCGLLAALFAFESTAKAQPADAAADVPTFAAPDRIRYDQQCFTINGVDTLVYSGSFHYFRCPQPLWADRFAALKQAGFNTLETYAAWNWAEQNPPANPDDFSQMHLDDLHDWLDMAINRFGFNVLLRPGPYICAEWDGGGYPQWIITKRPADYHGEWLRSDDPTYLAWCRHWYAAVAKVAAPFQITHMPAGKPGIILWQIENEYNYDKHPAEQKLHQLLALAHAARDNGIDLPLFTCETSNPLFRRDAYLRANVLETINQYPKYDMKRYVAALDGLRKYQPGRMQAISELQGGWFGEVGGKLSWQQGFTAAQLQHITLLAWAHGYTSTNYYMGFGGTNFGDWAADKITTTYDYDAPLHEPGTEGARYRAAQGMGRFIAENGPYLVRSELVPTAISAAPAGVTAMLRLGRSGSETRAYLFVFNDSQKNPAHGFLSIDAHAPDNSFSLNTTVDVDLPPFGSAVALVGGAKAGAPSANGEGATHWLPEPIMQPMIRRRPSDPMTLASIVSKPDPGPSTWSDYSGGGEESAGIYDRRFVFYRGTLSPQQRSQQAVLRTNGDTLGTHNAVVAMLDGQLLPPAPVAASVVGEHDFSLAPTTGGNGELLLLMQNGGRPNFGAKLECPGGIYTAELISGAQSTPIPLQISGQPLGWQQQWWSPELDESSWQPASITSAAPPSEKPALLVWYRLKFTTAPSGGQGLWQLHLDATGDGFLYLNGHPLGRWWHQGPQHDFFTPNCWLNTAPGASNVIALCLRPVDGTPIIKAASMEPVPPPR